jgi:hypothetical protein
MQSFEELRARRGEMEREMSRRDGRLADFKKSLKRNKAPQLNNELPPMSQKRVEMRTDKLEALTRVYDNHWSWEGDIPRERWGPTPTEILLTIQELLERRDFEGIYNFIDHSRFNSGTYELMRNEIVGQLERNPDDTGLFRLVKRLWQPTLIFGRDALPFEPWKPISIVIGG